MEELNTLLKSQADSLAINGIEFFLTTSAQKHEEIEETLNHAISEAKEPELEVLVRIRFLYRILRKYQSDILNGLIHLQKYRE